MQSAGDGRDMSTTELRPAPTAAAAPSRAATVAAPGVAVAPPAAAARSVTPQFVPKAVLVGVFPLLLVAAAGASYYALPFAARLRNPWHAWLGPTGYVGQSAGLLAFVLFSFLWLYPVRKRLSSATFLGPIPRWLDAHIVAGVLMPLAGAVHAGFRFEGLIGLGYFSMLVVALSGVVGRYLYVRIPRGRAGLELTREQVSAERRDILGTLVESTGLDPRQLLDLLRPVDAAPGGGVLHALGRMIRDDLDRRRAVRRLEAGMRGSKRKFDAREVRKVVRLARREMALGQQIRILDATNRVFRLWHAFHLPFAIMAFLAVAVHVIVAVLFGDTWLR